MYASDADGLLDSILYNLTKKYDMRDDFDFEFLNFPILLYDLPRAISCGVVISQFMRFARSSYKGSDFNNRNKF